MIIGAPGAIRTPDPLVRSQVLYPSELRARCTVFKISTKKLKPLLVTACNYNKKTGGERGIRTLDAGFARILP